MSETSLEMSAQEKLQQQVNEMEDIIERLSKEITDPIPRHIALAYLAVGIIASRQANIGKLEIVRAVLTHPG